MQSELKDIPITAPPPCSTYIGTVGEERSIYRNYPVVMSCLYISSLISSLQYLPMYVCTVSTLYTRFTYAVVVQYLHGEEV